MSTVEGAGGVDISGTIGTIGGDIVGGNKGLNERDLLSLLEAKGILAAAGLGRQVILMLASRLKPNEALSLDQAINEIQRAIDVALDVVSRGEKGGNNNKSLDELLARVAKHIKASDLDGGVQAVENAIANEEVRSRNSLRTLLEEGIKLDTLRRDACSAAQRIERIISIEEPTQRTPWTPAFKSRLDEYDRDGRRKGINFSLMIAVELGRRMIATAQGNDERGKACNLVAISLSTLGEREGGVDRLEESVILFQEALNARSRTTAPLAWAATQSNLGTALATLGQREHGTVRLRAAIMAFRAALEEQSRDRTSGDWAVSQTNLGNALSELGQREASSNHFIEAISAYEIALTERTRQREPLGWASIQSNLGIALSRLGTLEHDVPRLEDAVRSFRAALEELHFDSSPVEWAGVQNNLGTALLRLGQVSCETLHLEQAAIVFRLLLAKLFRNEIPSLWADAQNNLGLTLYELGIGEAGTTRWVEAEVAFRAALEERTRERVPSLWAKTTGALGIVLAELGERETGTSRLEDAVAAFRSALEEIPPNTSEWMTIHGNLSIALTTLESRSNRGGEDI